MRAAVHYRKDRGLAIEERADPVPGPGEMLLEVALCGICGSDLHMAGEGSYDRPGGYVFGHEYCGRVLALGEGVTGFAPGDRVAAMPVTGCGTCAACLGGRPAYCPDRRLEQGGYSTRALARAREALHLPDALPDAAGALIEPLAVGLHGVALAAMRPGARVLVIGAGPIGLATAFWARRLGAGPVLVTARSDRAAGLARGMGASGFLSGAAGADPGAVAEALGGAPDLVVECVGRAGLLDLAVAQVARGGTVVVQGICTGADSFHPRAAIQKEARLQFSAFFTLAEFRFARDVLAGGETAPLAMVQETIGLDALPDRFATLQACAAPGKVMVAPGR